MISSFSEVSTLFQPDDDTLSQERKAQVQLHRMLSLIGVVVLPLFSFVYGASNPDALDPTWDNFAVAGLYAGLLGGSYVSKQICRRYVLGFWGVVYVTMIWLTLVTALNHFDGDYAVSLLLGYAVLGVTVGLGARSFRSILGFLGIGFFLVAGGIAMVPAPRTSPSVLFASMVTVALIESIALRGRLSIREELAERERQLRSINENVSEGIYRSTPDEGIVYANQALAQMFGYDSPEAVCEADPADMYADPEMREQLRETSRSQGGIEPTEVLLRRRDGTTFYALMSGSIVRGEDGTVEYYDGAVTDITEQKQTEQALQEERDRLQTLFETLPTPVVRSEMREEGTFITAANPAFEEVFGVEAASVHGKDIDALLVPEEARAKAAEIDRRALSGGVQTEVKRKTAEGLRDFQLQVAGRRRDEGPPEIYAIYTDITEQKRRERKLKRRLDAMEAAPDGIAILNGDEEYIYVNQAHAEIYGYDSPDAFLGETWKMCYGEDELQRFEEEVMPSLFDEGDWRGEATGKRTDGSRFAQEVTLTTFEGKGLICIVRDITEQKERERKLRNTRNFYEQILDQIPIDLALHSPEARYEYVNSHGISDPEHREWIIGRTNEEYCRKRGLDPELGRQRDEAIRKSARTGERVELDETMQTDEGPRHYYRAHSPVIDLEGQVTSVAAFGFEITERKEMEKRLRERREKLESLYRATGRLLTAESQENVGEHVHEVLQEVFDYPLYNVGFVIDGMIVPSRTGIDEEDFQGPVPEPIPADDVSVAGRAHRTGETVVVEDLEALDNSIDYGDLRAAAAVPIGDYGVVVIGFEETDNFDPFDLRLIEVLTTYAAVVLGRLQYEDELLEAKEEAERMNKLKSAFLANMSHEIRTPLTSVIGFAEAIGEQVEVLEERPEEADLSQLGRFSGLIEQGGMRLLETLDGVLNLSKLEAGQMSLAREPINLSKKAEAVTEELRPQAREAGVSLSVESPSPPVWAMADEGGVQIIAQNLISNAVKYTEEGGQVWVRTHREGEQAVLEVEDTGIGMDPEMAEDIFEPFRQASEGTGRVYEGTGVGLTVTKQTVEDMGGQVDVETEKGEGSRFTVRLPKGGGE